MKNFQQSAGLIEFAIGIESVANDAVTGSNFSGNAYGDIVFKRATVDYPAWDFFFCAATIVNAGVSKAVTEFVQEPSTGFVGVKQDVPAIGDIITITGYYGKDLSTVTGAEGIDSTIVFGDKVTNSTPGGITTTTTVGEPLFL